VTSSGRSGQKAIALRLAGLSDGDMIRAWRNDPDAIRFSQTRSGVTAEEHAEWLSRSLADRAVRLWIAEVDGEPVGQTRIDIVNSCGTVSIAVAPAHRGRGHAAAILRALQSELRSRGPVEDLRAFVHRDNESSMRAFMSAGFGRLGEHVNGFVEFGWTSKPADDPLNLSRARSMNACESWSEQVREHVDDTGRVFRYAYVGHPNTTSLVVHFSAFFGEWGDAKPYRKTFKGYFHRLNMLGGEPAHDWLFLCDEFGVDGNGTYYAGEKGDLFVERAMLDLISRLMRERDREPSRTVFMGSSMGATGALKFGLQLGVKGIVAISPHIDLDICAATQGRERHVAFICPDGHAEGVHNWVYTRQIRRILEAWRGPNPPPRLFVQACRDDAGVYDEQVLPLVERWRAAGGVVDLDARPRGGHTSDHATKPLLLDVTARLLAQEPIDVVRYRTERAFRGKVISSTPSQRVRRLAARARRFLFVRG
jgi:RimJ/RimL family protein N-acetyltransferase